MCCDIFHIIYIFNLELLIIFEDYHNYLIIDIVIQNIYIDEFVYNQYILLDISFEINIFIDVLGKRVIEIEIEIDINIYYTLYTIYRIQFVLK